MASSFVTIRVATRPYASVFSNTLNPSKGKMLL